MGHLADHQAKFTEHVADLILWVSNSKPGWRVRLREVQRRPEMQQIYLDMGRSWTPNSWHLKSLAVDLMLDINGEWQAASEPYAELGYQWEKMSLFNRWGGRWADGNHFERRTFIRSEPDLVEPEVTA